jgi:hypothetical protein
MSTRRGLQILLALILFVIIGALLQGCATSLEVCPVVH